MDTIIHQLEKEGKVKVNRGVEISTVLPISGDGQALTEFQRYVEEIQRNDGLGYKILDAHPSSQIGLNFTDLIMVSWISD